MTDVLIPYSFVPGTKAMASEVNANFIALAKGVEDCKTFTNQSMENFNVQVNERLDEAIGDKLNTNLSNSVNIANCITEIPQRIKYTLVDGTLTIEAGSVVIVPYGLEDKTAEYPIGSKFLYDNFKVYDTQYAGGKFFVWVEIVEDIVTNTSVTSGDVATRLTEIDLTRNCSNAVMNTISSTAQYTGTSNCINYRTDLNLVQWSDAGSQALTGNVISLPFMVVTANGSFIYGSVKQLFEGVGYIGSTVWVDKGVKGLIPNGRNDDGTLKNIEITCDKIYTLNVTSTSFMLTLDNSGKLSHYYIPFVYKQATPPSVTTYCFWYDTLNNHWKYHAADVTTWSNFYPLELGEGALSNDVISKIDIKYPFRAVDYYDFQNKTNTLSKSYITQTYKSGYSWYRIWSDGWKEQGGRRNTTGTISFLKAFSDTNYTFTATQTTKGSSSSEHVNGYYFYSKAAGSIIMNMNQNESPYVDWYACGY